ncbi:hypothetical protein ACJZ2D_000614 [Fusarium nematophilum]
MYYFESEKKSLKRAETRSDPCTPTTLDIQIQDHIHDDGSLSFLPNLPANHAAGDLESLQFLQSDNIFTVGSSSPSQRLPLVHERDSIFSSSYPSPASPSPLDQIYDNLPASVRDEHLPSRSRSISTASHEPPSSITGSRGNESLVTPAKSACRWLSPLHMAAQRGHGRIIRILLQCDIDCNEQDSDGLTPIMHAVIGGHEDVARSLLMRGARVASCSAVDGQQRPSALHWAVLHRRENILRLLLSHCLESPALVDGYDHLGRTPLHIAIDTGFESAVLMLLRSGADPRHKARRAYVQVCAHPRGGIWQFEIDIRTAQLVTAPHLLWEGWDCRFTEGPHVYKKDDYYYLLVAEGGTFEDHMISIARSKSIDGPFEPCPSNPLLTSGGTRNYLHHTGHGDFFQDPSGDWWTVLLAVRRTGNHYPLGRETFLTRVDWPGYGWPTIHDPSSCNIAATQAANLLRRNGFVHLRDADPSKYKIYDRVVSILASAADLSSHKDTLSFAGRRQIHLEGSSSVVLRTPPDIPSGSLRSGICVYKDEHRFAALGLDFGRGIVYFEARNKASGYSATASMTVLRRERIGLCISYTGLEWTFLYRMDGEDWVKMGVVDTMRLSGRDFIGPIVGMFAVGLACRDRRKKCERSRPGISCNFCIKRGLECIGVLEPPAAALDRLMRRYEPLDSRAEEGRSRHVSSLVIPDAALSEELVDLYFRYAHIAFHNLFHRQTFIARVRDSSIPKILFFGVVSLSARYSTHPVFASIKPWDRGRPYRDETKRLLDLEDTSLTTIQACMLLAANASAEGDPNTESVYHTIAARMATLLDLPNMPTESLLEQEINRRVWWSLITTETWNSATHSLPRLIKPRDTVPLPMDESQFAALGYDVPVPPTDSAFQETSPPCENPQSLVAQMIRLNLLLYDIILLNARVVAEQAQGAIYRELDRGLVHALDGWVNNLSLQLRYSEENVGYWVEAGLGTMFVIMHINYNHAGQLLFYQHLHSAQDLEQEALGAKTARIFAQRCKQHATNLCDLIYRANQQPETEVLYPLAGHILSLASTVQIHTLLFGVDDGEILAAKTRLERNFEMISSLNNFWPMTHKSIQRLQHFHNACLRSQDDSFRLDTWMLRFLLGFTKDMEDRAGDWPHEQPSKEFDHLRNLLDI